jgi:hypothetical protein
MNLLLIKIFGDGEFNRRPEIRSGVQQIDEARGRRERPGA